MKGKFITFEGGECTGKTTIIKVIEEKLKKLNYDVLVTREPGGSKIAEEIREIILNPNNKEMASETEALLLAASRTQHIKEKIAPALAKNNSVILCDRYLDSSLVYQGYARGLGFDSVLKVNYYALNYLPNLTLLIDVKPEVALKRLANRQGKVDRLDAESLSFHQAVYDGYVELANLYKNRIVIVDGSKPLDEVVKDCEQIIFKYLGINHEL